MTFRNLIPFDAVLLIILFAWLPVNANDGYDGNSGFTLYPLEHPTIRLVREIVDFKQTDDRNVFDVRAELVFFNPSDEDISLRAGFPFIELKYDERQVVGFDDDFRVSVNGEAMPVSPEPFSKKSFRWNRIYYFEAFFPAKSHTIIVNEFRLHDSGIVDGYRELPYVLSTGATWAGKIDEAVFRYEFKFPPMMPGVLYWMTGLPTGSIQINDPSRDVTTVYPVEGDTSGAHYSFSYVHAPNPVFTITLFDFEPQEHLKLITYEYLTNLREVGMPIGRAFGKYHNIIKCFQCLCRFNEDLKLTDELLTCYEPHYLRNFVYARRGYEFKDPELRKEFYESGWFFPPTAPFDPEWLSPEEVQAIEKLKELEAQEARKNL